MQQWLPRQQIALSVLAPFRYVHCERLCSQTKMVANPQYGHPLVYSLKLGVHGKVCTIPLFFLLDMVQLCKMSSLSQNWSNVQCFYYSGPINLIIAHTMCLFLILSCTMHSHNVIYCVTMAINILINVNRYIIFLYILDELPVNLS